MYLVAKFNSYKLLPVFSIEALEQDVYFSGSTV